MWMDRWILRCRWARWCEERVIERQAGSAGVQRRSRQVDRVVTKSAFDRYGAPPPMACS